MLDDLTAKLRASATNTALTHASADMEKSLPYDRDETPGFAMQVNGHIAQLRPCFDTRLIRVSSIGAFYVWQLYALSKREALGWWRNKPALIASVVIPAMLNLVFSCVFFQVGDVRHPGYNMMAHFGAFTILAISGQLTTTTRLLSMKGQSTAIRFSHS